MSQERSSEESKRKILEVAERLFLEKGYDDTSISDIVKGLGGMTKGAIYHHFKSKQDIFENILSTYSSENPFDKLKGNNGLEKLRDSLHKDLTNFKKQSVNYAGVVYFRTPRLIGEQFLSLYEIYIPMVEDLILEGIEDGSIQTEYPREIAELLLIFTNMLIGIQLNRMTCEEAKRKIYFLKDLLESLNVPLFDESLTREAIELIEYLKRK